MSKPKLMLLAAPLIIFIFIVAGGQIVLHLWNWLLPPLFGWREITFWQALGLLALCRILFGGLGGPGGSRTRHMTPEQREQFRQRIRERCGGPPTTNESAGEAQPG